ncbi:unnamed protein product [Closterium sp. NIES-65]|nr:unnamed protein product [Closterium sp. NIES-65]
MDGETERKIAALILAEAQRLKARAAEEGVRAYLKPHVRYRPNSQFLRATVQSVEYANRVADVNEMWKERELELAESRRERREDSAERPTTSRDARGGGSVGEARRTQRNQQYGYDYLERQGREPVEDHKRYGGRHETEERRAGQEKEQRLDGTGEYEVGIGDGPVQGNGHREIQRGKEHKKRPRQDDGEGVGMGSWSDADAEQKGIDDSDLLTFLKTKAKRGRGAIGSRADAWGSEPPSQLAVMQGDAKEGSGAVGMLLARVREEWEDSVS